MNTPVIEAKGLQKRYGRAMAVDGIDLSIGRGEVFGLLGPNGSGKTTTILMLLGLTEPTGGAVRVLSYDPLRQPLEVKRRVGYLPDSVGFYDHWSAAENLSYTARLAGIESAEARRRVDDSLARVGLAGFANRRTSTFSHGMRQRLGLAEILVKQPVVAILDEPTNGLDPQATHELLGLIGELRGDGMTILLSSHLLGLVETICDRVALFNQGKVGLSGRVEDLTRDVLGGSYVVEVEAENIDLPSVLSDLQGVAAVASPGGQKFRVDADRDLRPDIARLVVGRGGALRNMAIRRAGLDEVYVKYFERARAGETEAAHAA
jgi:ABC-2 type transport system ATP-binding protein